MNPVNGFILAGGKSTRMGRDKALLDWHGQTLLEHMVDLLSAATERVQVVGRERLPDALPDRGPLSGIFTALSASETDANLVVAVDLPLLTRDFLKYLRSRFESCNQSILACKIGSRIPLCLGIRRELRDDLWTSLIAGDLSVHGFIDRRPAEVVSGSDLIAAGFDISMFRNINTEEDYRSALQFGNSGNSGTDA